jgi:Ribbon-helix-helix protein, copG family
MVTMEPDSASPEKWSISMTKSDMQIIDSIATKMGLSRSELIRQSVAKYAKDNNLSDGYVAEEGVKSGAIDWIISRSHGLLGDFKMPVCTELIVQHGLAGRLSDKDLRKVLARYRQHVDFWKWDDVIVQTEIGQFVTRTQSDKQKVWEIFYSSNWVPPLLSDGQNPTVSQSTVQRLPEG